MAAKGGLRRPSGFLDDRVEFRRSRQAPGDGFIKNAYAVTWWGHYQLRNIRGVAKDVRPVLVIQREHKTSWGVINFGTIPVCMARVYALCRS